MVSRGAHRYVSGEGWEGGRSPRGGGGGGAQKKKKKLGRRGGGGGGAAQKIKNNNNKYYIYIPPPPLPFSERDSHVLAPGVILLNAERFIDSRNRTQDVWILCTSTRCTLLLFNIEEAIV